MRAWFRFVLRHRVATLVVVGLVSVLAGASVSRAVIASSVGKLFLGNSPEYLSYQVWTKAFVNDELLLVGFEGEQVLEADRQAALGRAVEVVRAHPDIGSVTSVLDVQRLVKDGPALRAERPTEQVVDGELTVEEAWAAIRADRFAGGLLTGSDATSAMIVELTQVPERSAETIPGIVDFVREALEAEGFDGLRFGGMIRTLAEIMALSADSLFRLFPFVALALLICVWLLFRRFTPAILSLGVSGVGALWTMGIAVQIDRDINILMAIVPAVALIVGFSDVVHLCAAYLLELEHGKDRDEAVLASADDVGRACLWTSATTFVGFLSLSLIPTPVFRVLGLVLGLGVGIALALAVTLVPIALSYLPAPKPLRSGSTVKVQAAVDQVLDGMRRLATHRPWLVIAMFSVLAAVSGYGVATMEIETDFRERLRDDNPASIDLGWFGDHFQGSNGLNLYLEVDEPDGLLEPAVIHGVAALQAEVTAWPEVDSALSVVDLLGTVQTTLRPDALALPQTRPEIAQSLLLFEIAGGEGLERFVDHERRRMAVALRLRPEAFRETATVARRIEEAARVHVPAARVEATSLPGLVGEWLDEIVSGQRRGLALSAAIIAVMMVIALRSLGVGLISMIPNLLPLFALAGFFGLRYEDVDSDALILLLLAIGIGVDDTIHFLVRLRVESRRCDPEEAIRRTFDFAGRAIVMTTVILVVGFLPMALSGYFTLHILGALLPIALIVALLGDLLLVPAMVQLGWIRFPGPDAAP